MVNYETKSLALVLASLNYDVWLGNNRGNKYSNSHANLYVKSKKFWEFSFHEMGVYDLPAMINYIRKTSGVDKITYIGHSQGTTQMFAGLSLNNKYFQQVLNGFIALGPVTNLANIGSTFIKVVASSQLDSLFNYLGIKELFESSASVTKIELLVCKTAGLFCNKLLQLISDENPKNDDKDRLLVFFGHFPSGSSLQSIHHYAEIVRAKKFQQLNNEEYKLENITGVPIGLFVGNEDELATVQDNRILKTRLSADVLKFYKEYEDMGHSTFFLSKTNAYVPDLLAFVDYIYSS